MDEHKDGGRRRVLGERADDGRVGYHICGELAGLNVEDEDKDSDGGKDMCALVCQVVLYEAILSAHCQHRFSTSHITKYARKTTILTLRSPRGSASDSP